MRDWSPRFIDNISKKKKVQSVLVNHKPKVSTFTKEKWERETLDWRAEAKKHSEQYKNRLTTDKDFAKHAEEKHKAENERQKKKIDQKQKQQNDEDIQLLFENFFGKKGFGDPLGTHTG